MEEKKTIFTFLGAVLLNYGFCMVSMMILCRVFGDAAKGYSSMFSMGSQALPVPVMAEFLLVSTLCVGVRYLFFSEAVFKNWGTTGRTLGMLLSILVIIGGAIVAFHWFPLDAWEAWAMFFLCFLLCFGGSCWIMKLENRKMEQGLEDMKKKWEADKNGKQH